MAGEDDGTVGGASGSREEGTAAGAKRARPRGRKRRWAKRVLAFALFLVGLVASAFVLLTRTPPGQELLLRAALPRVQGVVEGRITVDGVRSRNLLKGATLVGVRIEGPDGRPFLQVDSVSATYAWRTLLAGDVVLSSLDVFQPALFVTRRPGEERFNTDAIFGGEEEPDTSSGGGRRVAFYDVSLVGGTVRVLYPQEGAAPAGALTVETPEGRVLRRFGFDDVHASLSRVLVTTPEVAGPHVTVESFSTVVRAYEDPVRLGELEGLVTWIEGRLTVEAESIRVGETRASGTIVADTNPEEGLALSLDVETPEAHLGDFQWLEPRLPDGTARGGLRLDILPSELRWRFEDVTADLGGSEIEADGGWVMAGQSMSFDGLRLDFSPLDLEHVRPWIEAELPVDGRVRGNARLDGTLDRLRTEGHLTLQESDDDAPGTTADFGGVLHLGEQPGATDLQATFDPLDYDLVARLTGAGISGVGRGRVQATGRLATGLRFTLDGVHRDRGVPASMLVAQGSLREVEDEVVLDVTADAGPLSFTALRRYFPGLPLSGEVRGLIRAVGPLSDLSVTTDLESAAGRLALEARFDARDPTSSYEVQGDVSRFRVSALVPGLPEPTLMSGNVRVTGRGVDPATADVDARLRARRARVGNLMVDTAAVDVRISSGRLRLDTFQAVAGGMDVSGTGTLAVLDSLPAGEIRVRFEADSVGGLRPLLLGDTVIARDTLTALDRGLLALEGVDPDSLPTRGEVDLRGAASGEVLLRGSLESFSAEGELGLQRFEYGDHSLRDARLSFSAGDLPSLDGEVHAELRADSLRLYGRGFQGGALDLDYTRPGGRFELALARSDEEDYRARAVFDVDTLGGRAELEEVVLRFDTLSWELQRRATVDWNDQGVTVRDLELVRAGPDPMRVTASGTLPRHGRADFDLDVEGLELRRITQLLQREDMELEGRVGLELQVRGTAAEPVITGELQARDVSYDAFELSRVEGELDYQDRQLVLDLGAWRDDLRVLTAKGTVPADLALTTGVVERFPPEEIDLRVAADSLPASFLLSLVETLDEVTGTVDGDFTIAGTVEDPSPSGTLALEGAGFLLPALGVRYRDVRGTLELRPDGTVDVNATARAGGSVDVTGTVTLEPLTNPQFDLLIDLDRFRAVSRRDVEGVVSGEVTLTGTFELPRVQGLEGQGRGLVVDRGTLFLEEFQRSSTVVDLSDPRFFDMADTTLARARPILTESQNPFLRNLIVNVDLGVNQDTWIRSEQMNVEMRGDLVVVYDRQQNDIVLVGELEAVRGDYSVLGRRFEVQDGVVEFVGTPGINPNLEITARTRVRRPPDEPLTVTATVTGTLVDPRVALSSQDAAVPEEDLISYLLFGQPTYALTSGQAASVQSAAGTIGGQAVGFVAGTLTNRLGSLVAREIGLDYFAISQPTDLLNGEAGALEQTTVELGRYIDRDLFVVLVIQPFQTAQVVGAGVAGGRIEWTASDLYTVEIFLENRFLRSGVFGFQNLAVDAEAVWGVSVFWEWGY
ncbi:MAG: translocation/assembly module TamB domain-containing protein [Gemmatimonadota bacterium]|jgi:autotransporter translocation and assembly factor TamB